MFMMMVVLCSSLPMYSLQIWMNEWKIAFFSKLLTSLPSSKNCFSGMTSLRSFNFFFSSCRQMNNVTWHLLCIQIMSHDYSRFYIKTHTIILNYPNIPLPYFKHNLKKKDNRKLPREQTFSSNLYHCLEWDSSISSMFSGLNTFIPSCPREHRGVLTWSCTVCGLVIK